MFFVNATWAKVQGGLLADENREVDQEEDEVEKVAAAGEDGWHCGRWWMAVDVGELLLRDVVGVLSKLGSLLTIVVVLGRKQNRNTDTPAVAQHLPITHTTCPSLPLDCDHEGVHSH